MAKMFGTTNWLLLGLLSCLLVVVKDVGATILLFGNETASFPSMDASFTPPIPEAGIYGEVYVADPLTGCSDFAIQVTDRTVFAVVQRGECLFEVKVRNSQNAGFTGTIVFDNGESDLVTMSGDGQGITTYALFVSKAAGESLLSLEGNIYILPGQKKTTFSIKWVIICVSIVAIVIVGALVTALCCIRAHILAEAEKEAANERLLEDDYDILNREFIPDDEGPKAESVATDADGETINGPSIEDPSESNHTPANR
ncbi:unnamed protein product [Calypogeia fissa]